MSIIITDYTNQDVIKRVFNITAKAVDVSNLMNTFKTIVDVSIKLATPMPSSYRQFLIETLFDNFDVSVVSDKQNLLAAVSEIQRDILPIIGDRQATVLDMAPVQSGITLYILQQ